MIEIVTEYPYNNNYTLVKTYAIDELGNYYKIQQVQTGIIFDEAIDAFPPKYNYVATEEKILTEEELLALEEEKQREAELLAEQEAQALIASLEAIESEEVIYTEEVEGEKEIETEDIITEE